ncbi:hypothetical protein [Shigella flexneri]|uniref:hypothetical protein n=1 Tax=Shigella flexneri TaxID=623 RepID=UPI001493D7A0|nr:hypothetical protein [Shigella flexneri]
MEGCETKQYQQAANVTGPETSAMDCKEEARENAKRRRVKQEIEETGECDGGTVLGLLGDFGIGNGMAKGEARKKAANRINQLEALKAAKCADQ